jgi:hypothetical protein
MACNLSHYEDNVLRIDYYLCGTDFYNILHLVPCVFAVLAVQSGWVPTARQHRNAQSGWPHTVWIWVFGTNRWKVWAFHRSVGWHVLRSLKLCVRKEGLLLHLIACTGFPPRYDATDSVVLSVEGLF